ncbi:MAG: DUF4231 domain-containing protein, partial [Acetobacteraceae bacterium]|nr:DUF4231 domain-containing protein [Acetobacteraceae bacterium]
MIENAWDEYRGWAKRSRDLQNESQKWTTLALLFAVLAAALGAAAGQADTDVWWGRVLAFLAAACAAVVPVLGQDILAVGREAAWIRARATAEAIKSECYRFAAHVGDYAGASAADLFRERRDKIIEEATRTGLTPSSDPAKVDARRPSEPVAPEWYLEHRVREQKTHYAIEQTENETRARWLRQASLAAAVLAAVLGAASSTFGVSSLAPWIGVLTTLGTMIVAYGLMERRQYLAASYGAMVGALGRIEERFANG